ncbi:MAG: DsbA family protein [Mesorhizobium sp.]|jgi:protein-disulfide isomerase
MTKAVLLSTTAAAVGLAILASGFIAGRQTSAIQDPIQAAASLPAAKALDQKGVELIVRDYLLANPEILMEVQVALEAKQKEEQRIANLGVIKNAKDEIFNSSFDGVVGNPNGPVTIVEFYDYNCGYCKRAIEDMRALTSEDPDLRFVLKEFPILGPDSQKAHMVSMAFRKLMPEKFSEFHNGLLGGPGRATEASALKLALSLGANEADLRDAMKDPAIPAAFEKTFELANKLSVTGTPSYVVGNEVVFGALGQEVLAEKIEAARACLQDATC